MLYRTRAVLVALVLCTPVSSGLAATQIDQCLLDALRLAPDDTTVGQLRAECEETLSASPPPPTGAVQKRLDSERSTEDSPWVITPHRSNYLLPVSYNANLNREPFEVFSEADDLKDTEVNFQISFKFPLVRDLGGSSGDLYFAYTNQSWWQLYAGDISAPFRETNHEPEIFFRFDTDWRLGRLRNTLLDVGFVHQSNGRAGSLSRSWNRVYASFVMENGDFAMALKPWIVVGDIEDNPDIEDYLGYGDLRLAYLWDRHTFTGLVRNNLSTSDNRGAVELTWSYPLYEQLRWYAKYTYGYGESLLDYNVSANRLGLGIAINDVLQH